MSICVHVIIIISVFIASSPRDHMWGYTDLGEVPHGEVAAPSATTCWRCKGATVVSKKVPADSAGGADTVRKANFVVDVACPVCAGVGSLGRKRARPVADSTSTAPRKTFEGWVQVGPHPAGLSASLPAEGEELCALTGRWGIFQGALTHRYSTDDVVTAWVAWRVGLVAAAAGLYGAAGGPRSLLDIGTGIGSVLSMMAWLYPQARCVGLEAQPTRAAAAGRSIAYNGIGDRVRVAVGDLRDAAAVPAATAAWAHGGGGYDIVTGTPPYFNVSAGGLPAHEEAARCLYEYRGGMEAYAAAGAALLAPHGLLVLAGAASGLPRGYEGAASAGLRVIARVDVVPKAGKPPLFLVYILCKAEAPFVGTAGAAAAPLLPACFGPLPRHSPSLAYPDMRTDGYAAWLERPHGGAAEAEEGEPAVEEGAEAKEAGTVEGGAGSAGGAPARKYPPRVRPRQAARGVQVDWAGRPYAPGPAASGAGTELVHTLLVRSDTPGCPRTPAYRELLWELGKPG